MISKLIVSVVAVLVVLSMGLAAGAEAAGRQDVLVIEADAVPQSSRRFARRALTGNSLSLGNTHEKPTSRCCNAIRSGCPAARQAANLQAIG